MVDATRKSPTASIINPPKLEKRFTKGSIDKTIRVNVGKIFNKIAKKSI